MGQGKNIARMAAVTLCALNVVTAFNLAALPAFLKPLQSSSLASKKAALLEAVSFTNNGKTATPETQAKVLSIVGEIESSAPPSENLLSDPNLAKGLDGVWYLQYTSPSNLDVEGGQIPEWKPEYASEGEANIETRQFNAKGTVSAIGVTVDTSNTVTKQIFDVERSTVSNEVQLGFGLVRVAGTFRPSAKVPRRAVVSFKELDITLNSGLKLKLDFVFALAAILRGSKESGWLETSYLGDDMRIGRGNKGTMFVLTRDPDAVKP